MLFKFPFPSQWTFCWYLIITIQLSRKNLLDLFGRERQASFSACLCLENNDSFKIHVLLQATVSSTFPTAILWGIKSNTTLLVATLVNFRKSKMTLSLLDFENL